MPTFSSCRHHIAALAALAPVCVFSLARPLFGGTIRHDRDPQAYLELAQDPRFASAGLFRITRSEPGFSGSGVLVGTRWVLTAAHLLEGSTDMTFAVGGREYAADGWVAHPRFDGDLRKGFDLALVRLGTAVDAGVAPAGLNRSRREQGQAATFVGFGRTGTGLDGGQPRDEVDFRARAGTNVIDGTADLKLGFGKYKPKLGGGRSFVVDFDNPANPAADNTTGAAAPTDLELLIAQGDSGGPVYLDPGDGSAPLVAGIHSFGEFRDERDDSDYGDVTGHTRVSVMRPWIEKTIRRGELGRSIPDFVNAGGATAMELGPVSPAAVPEPGTGVLLLPLALLCRRRRRAVP